MELKRNSVIAFIGRLDAIICAKGLRFTNIVFKTQDEDGFTDNYSEHINGATHNDFTIAYRTLHSIIPDDIRLCNEARKIIAKYPFSDILTNLTVMEATPAGFDNVVRGMSFASMMKFDTIVTAEVVNKMFKGKNPYGSDLMMMDIQRGRDHGVPGYNAYRGTCGVGKARYFSELTNIKPDKIDILQSLYDHPDDIDLVVGGVFEDPVPGTKFGPVVSCILEQQFYLSMAGDRFFYTNKNQPYPFTADQLREIKKSSFSALVCKNSDNVQHMPKNAFMVESRHNQRVSCDQIYNMNLSYWQEKA